MLKALQNNRQKLFHVHGTLENFKTHERLQGNAGKVFHSIGSIRKTNNSPARGANTRTEPVKGSLYVYITILLMEQHNSLQWYPTPFFSFEDTVRKKTTTTVKTEAPAQGQNQSGEVGVFALRFYSRNNKTASNEILHNHFFEDTGHTFLR